MFKIFAPNFLVFTIYNCIIIDLLFIVFYKILKKLKMRQDFAVITTLICFLSIQDKLIIGGANYNTLAFIFFELGLYFILDSMINEWSSKKKVVVQSIALFLVFFTNQKLGVGYAISLIVFEIMLYGKKGTINIIKTMGLFALYSSIVMLIFYCKGNLYDFINICFLGMLDFKGNLKADDGALYLIIYLSAITLGVVSIKNIKDEFSKKNIKALMIFAIGSLVLCVPIFNTYHCKLPGILFVLLLIYSLYEAIKDMLEEDKSNEIINFIKTIIVVVFILCIPKYTIHIIQKHQYIVQDITSPYFGAILLEEYRDNIKVVTDYVKEQEAQGKDTYFVSNYAMYYVVETGKSHGYFDMLNRGNYGLNGDKNMIEKIKKMNNSIILVYNKDRSKYECYQMTTEIKEFIENNYKFIGELENYDVYEISN